MKIEECFRIGTVTKTRGLKGELQAFIDFDVPEKLNFDALFIESAGRLIPYFVESFKMPQKTLLLFTSKILIISIRHRHWQKKIFTCPISLSQKRMRVILD